MRIDHYTHDSLHFAFNLHCPTPSSHHLWSEKYSRSHTPRSNNRPISRTSRRHLSNHPLRRLQHTLIHLTGAVQETLLALDKQFPVAGVADSFTADLTRGAEVVYGVSGRA